jgi:hypothetical protein
MSTPETPPSNDEAATMLWEEERRLLARQEASLDTLRVQAVAILSVASIVAGLFGSHFVTSNPSGFSLGMVVAALAIFAVTALIAVVIISPRTWTFDQDLTDDLAKLGEGEYIKASSLAYSWADDAEGWRADNHAQLEKLMCYFQWACILTGLQVVLWGLALL